MIVCLCLCAHTHVARQTVEREANAGAKPAALGAPVTLRRPYPTAVCRPPASRLPHHLWDPTEAKARQQALTVTTAGQWSFMCRSRGTMLWYTWVRRLLGSLPAIAATRSPNSAMAAARILSRSCKTGGSEP